MAVAPAPRRTWRTSGATSRARPAAPSRARPVAPSRARPAAATAQAAAPAGVAPGTARASASSRGQRTVRGSRRPPRPGLRTPRPTRSTRPPRRARGSRRRPRRRPRTPGRQRCWRQPGRSQASSATRSCATRGADRHRPPRRATTCTLEGGHPRCRPPAKSQMRSAPRQSSVVVERLSLVAGPLSVVVWSSHFRPLFCCWVQPRSLSQATADRAVSLAWTAWSRRQLCA
mmetsp:Transcript_90604/g.256589  ORF Transcript_90604/g.256589 Transcript_90604/m.256589 type:complete len:230 (+) Transcript_90604:199-888(+)